MRDTVALTGLRSGLKHNVIPGRAEATLDVRILPDTDAAAFLRELEAVPALMTPELNRSFHGVDERFRLEELERAVRVTTRVLRRLAG